MCKQLELSYIGTNGEVKLPLENWQYAVIAQVLGLSIREDGPCTEIGCFPKEFVMQRVQKMGILLPSTEAKV